MVLKLLRVPPPPEVRSAFDIKKGG